jgi:hypothetical protein
LNKQYQFSKNAVPFDHLFEALTPHRAYAFHIKIDCWTAELPKKRNDLRLKGELVRMDVYEPLQRKKFLHDLLSDFHGACNWSTVNPIDVTEWVVVFRPFWQFCHPPIRSVEDRVDQVDIDSACVRDRSLAALLVTDSGTLSWEALQEFASLLPDRDWSPTDGSFFASEKSQKILFEVWNSAEFAAIVRPVGRKQFPSVPFGAWFHVTVSPDCRTNQSAMAARMAETSDFRIAVHEFCEQLKNHAKATKLRNPASQEPKRIHPSRECFLPRGELVFVSILDRTRTEIVLDKFSRERIQGFDHIACLFAD